ncbi:MAG: class I SAM-dependent methyltransferase [Actinomycetota bacterium]
MTSQPGQQVSERWAQWRRDIPLHEYHRRWEHLEADGTAPHGEVDFIVGYAPSTVLDAGCGMGRVAIELSRRGIDVDGVDLDDDLLAYARHDAPKLTWVHGDLVAVQMPRRYDLVAMPGNVMIFCRIDDRAPIVANMARHVLPGGRLVAGFSLDQQPGALTLAEYDAACEAAGLVLDERFSTWERALADDAGYAVSVHCPR